MFLDVLDTARTMIGVNSEQVYMENMIQGETMLYYALLMGKKPTLTQTQVTDSPIIFNILNGQYKSEFLELIKEDKIRICLYPKIDSLEDYFVKCLKYGVEDESDFFDFAMFPFLREKEVRERRNIQFQMIKVVTDNARRFRIEGLTGEENEYIREYINTIEEIEEIVRSRYLRSTRFKVHMDDVFKQYTDGILKGETYSLAIKELVKYINSYKDGKEKINRRSIYYKLLESECVRKHFDQEAISNVKTIIDYSYNLAVASAVDDKEGANINIREKYIEASKLMEASENCKEKKLFNLQQIDAKNYLTWEDISPLLKEIERLEEEKNYSREDALQEIRNKQLKNPIIKLSKYVGLSIITAHLPTTPIVELANIILNSIVQDAFCEILRKPSLKDIKDNVKRGIGQIRILDQAIIFNSFIQDAI